MKNILKFLIPMFLLASVVSCNNNSNNNNDDSETNDNNNGGDNKNPDNGEEEKKPIQHDLSIDFSIPENFNSINDFNEGHLKEFKAQYFNDLNFKQDSITIEKTFGPSGKTDHPLYVKLGSSKATGTISFAINDKFSSYEFTKIRIETLPYAQLTQWNQETGTQESVFLQNKTCLKVNNVIKKLTYKDDATSYEDEGIPSSIEFTSEDFESQKVTSFNISTATDNEFFGTRTFLKSISISYLETFTSDN